MVKIHDAALYHNRYIQKHITKLMPVQRQFLFIALTNFFLNNCILRKIIEDLRLQFPPELQQTGELQEVTKTSSRPGPWPGSIVVCKNSDSGNIKEASFCHEYGLKFVGIILHFLIHWKTLDHLDTKIHTLRVSKRWLQ
jgi:hypothetical protein